MKDICVFIYKDEIKLGNELKNELELIGGRLDIVKIINIADLSSNIKLKLSKYSSVLLVISSAFYPIIFDKNIKIKINNKKFISICYLLKKAEISKIKKNFNNLVISKTRSISNLANDVIKELADNKRNISLKSSNKIQDIWDSPLTIFRKKERLSDVNDTIVDVTWSSLPTKPEPSPVIISTLQEVLKYMGDNKKFDILDFGAGKLRHTILLLKEKHKVCAVEYRELFVKPTSQIKKLLKKAESYGNKFGKITYPSDFIILDKKFDLILLINVINIIPDMLERLFVLDQCNRKLKKGKYFFWFTQHGDISQRESANYKITDGGCIGNKSRRTFYTEFNINIINLLMAITGFKRIYIKFDAWTNKACLYQKVGDPIIDFQKLALDMRKILDRKANYGIGERDTIIADVIDADDFITVEKVLKFALNEVPLGKPGAYAYETCMKYIIEHIFSENFITADIQKQYKIYKKRYRIDIKASWRENSGLKKRILEYDYKSSWIPIECKNYSDDLGSKEFEQIVYRCNKHHRHIGIITCRKIDDMKKLQDSQQYVLNNHGYLIIVLDDNDINFLLKIIEEKRSYPPWDSKKHSSGFDEEKSDPVSDFIIKRIEEVTSNLDRKLASDLLS